MIDLKELIQNASEIPPLPASAARLASLVLDEREDRDLDEIVEAVTYDPVLTGKVLRWANSVVSGSAEQILTVKEALIRMGTGPLLQVVIASNVKPQMAKALPEYGLSEKELWHHSVASALAVNSFQRTLTVNIPKEAFVAALLHDIGKLILSRYLGDDHLQWLKEARLGGGVSACRAESEILDVHHGEVGGLMAQHWNLPERIVQGIIYHHTPEENDDPISYIVGLANIVAKSLDGGIEKETIDSEESSAIIEKLEVSAESLERSREMVQGELVGLLRSY